MYGACRLLGGCWALGRYFCIGRAALPAAGGGGPNDTANGPLCAASGRRTPSVPLGPGRAGTWRRRRRRYCPSSAPAGPSDRRQPARCRVPTGSSGRGGTAPTAPSRSAKLADHRGTRRRAAAGRHSGAAPRSLVHPFAL